MDSSKREDTKKEYEATEWIRANVELTESDPVASLYDRMESQSGEQLAVVYAPFDGRQGPHFCDYGRILDFAVACGTAAVGCDIADARILDFGPGDGWPALLIAPMVSEVVGVEGSKRRVEVCARNAERLGIENARFVHVPPGNPLPFDDNSFDGVTAASSVEQTPDPRSTLKELYRVLKPGGALRMFYESLARYRGGHEHDIWFGDLDGAGYLLVFVRDIDGEMVRHYALVFDCPKSKIDCEANAQRRVVRGAALQPAGGIRAAQDARRGGCTASSARRDRRADGGAGLEPHRRLGPVDNGSQMKGHPGSGLE